MANLLSFPNVTFELLPQRRADSKARRRRGSGSAFGWLAPAEGRAEKRTAAAAGNMPRQTAEPGETPGPPGEDPEKRRAPRRSTSHQEHRSGPATRRGVYNGWTMALSQTLRHRQAGFPAWSAGLPAGPSSPGFPRRALGFPLEIAIQSPLGKRHRGERLFPAHTRDSGNRSEWSRRTLTHRQASGSLVPAEAVRCCAAVRAVRTPGGPHAATAAPVRRQAPDLARRTPPRVGWRLRAFAETDSSRNGGFVQHGLYEIRLSPARNSL